MNNIQFSATVPLQYDTPFSPFRAKELSTALDWLVSSGFDGIEPCISDYDGIDVQRFHRMFEDKGLGVSTISTGQAYGREGISLTDPDARVRQKCCDRIYAHIDAAAQLGSLVTIGLLRGKGTQQDIQGQKDLLATELQKCAERARKSAVTLIFEPINRYECTLINSVKDACDYIDAAGIADTVGILWDMFHSNIEDDAPEKVIEQYGRRMTHVHIADSNRAFPGYGKIDIKAIYKKLLTEGYNGYMSFEFFNVPDVQTVIDGAAGFLHMLKG